MSVQQFVGSFECYPQIVAAVKKHEKTLDQLAYVDVKTELHVPNVIQVVELRLVFRDGSIVYENGHGKPFEFVPLQKTDEKAMNEENDREPFTLTTPYVPSTETWEEYVLRCTDIANYAVQRSAHLSKPSAIDFSDTTKFRKISETAYEAITPGYQNEDWQSIETAPINERVLVFVPIKHHRLVIAMKTEYGLWLSEDLQPMSYPPTRWMNLPTPPKDLISE